MRALIRIYSSLIARTVKASPLISSFQYTNIAVIAVEPAVEYSCVKKHSNVGKDQYKAELTLSPYLCVKPLIITITAIASIVTNNYNNSNHYLYVKNVN